MSDDSGHCVDLLVCTACAAKLNASSRLQC